MRKDLLDSGAIRDYADLRGRRIAVAAMGTTAEVVVGRALEKAGLALADAEIVEIPYTDMLTALSTGAIDIGVAPEPAGEEGEPEAEARRDRNIAYLIVGGAGLIIAILIGLWLGQDVSGGNSAPEANVTLPQAPPAEQENLVAPASPTNVRALPNPEQLSRAFAAAFGTSGSASERGPAPAISRAGRRRAAAAARAAGHRRSRRRTRRSTSGCRGS